jgi:hypothetical protein
MLNIGDIPVAELFSGAVGVKTAAVGDKTIYTRPGGYFYLELETEKEK